MSDIAKVIKEEIRRISKQQARSISATMKKDVVRQKRFIADLKRRIAQLEKDNRWLVAEEKLRQKNAPVITEKTDKARITAKGVRAMRKKLGVSQEALAKLIGVSGVTVCLWEQRNGPLKVRDGARAGIMALRGIGAREAQRRLELLATKTKKPVKKRKKVKKAKKNQRIIKRGKK